MRKATKAIFLRVTEEEYYKMHLIAEAYDMTITEMVRFWAFGPKEGPKPAMGLKTQSEQAA